MIFNKDLIVREVDKKKELENELTENDFIEINKDISKALEEMKNEKDKEEDNFEDKEEYELNDLDIDFFSSNNSSTSMDFLIDNNDNSFKSTNIESNKNKNLDNNFKNNANNKDVNNEVIMNFNCIYNNNYIINNSNIGKKSFPLNKSSSYTSKHNSNSFLDKFKDNSFNSKQAEENINTNNYKINDNNLWGINENIYNKIPFLFINDNYYMSNGFINKWNINYNINNNIIRNNSNSNLHNNININCMTIGKNNMNKKDYQNVYNTPSFSEENDKNHKNNVDSPQNIIHIDDILRGKDKRATLIIRNIPNKYTISKLLKELNNNFYNQFDVLYLPEDQANKANLGYGFINFIDYIYLIKFYDIYQGKKWDSFQSNKRCQLAYSKYQGKNELIKYIHKKLGITKHLNNNDNLRKSFFITNKDKYHKPLIEIPYRYSRNIINSYSLCYSQNDKIFEL